MSTPHPPVLIVLKRTQNKLRRNLSGSRVHAPAARACPVRNSFVLIRAHRQVRFGQTNPARRAPAHGGGRAKLGLAKRTRADSHFGQTNPSRPIAPGDLAERSRDRARRADVAAREGRKCRLKRTQNKLRRDLSGSGVHAPAGRAWRATANSRKVKKPPRVRRNLFQATVATRQPSNCHSLSWPGDSAMLSKVGV